MDGVKVALGNRGITVARIRELVRISHRACLVFVL